MTSLAQPCYYCLPRSLRLELITMSEFIVSEEWSEMGAAPTPGLPAGVGERFPDLVLPSVETGEPLSLDGFGGGPLLLHVFASW